jgi:hypothetical protein
MKYDEVRYVATNGKEYIADFLDRFIKEIKNIEDVFDLVTWDSLKEAESALNWLRTQIDSKEELKEFEEFYIKPVKIQIEL